MPHWVVPWWRGPISQKSLSEISWPRKCATLAHAVFEGATTGPGTESRRALTAILTVLTGKAAREVEYRVGQHR